MQLSIDTLLHPTSVALQTATASWQLPLESGPSQMSEQLLPALQTLLAQAAPNRDQPLSLADCRAIVCTQGPGAFTAVRLAIAVSHGLAYPHQTPCIAVPSLMTLAYQGWCLSLEKNLPVCSVIDARMNQVYWAVYRFSETQVEVCVAPRLASVQDFVAPPHTLCHGFLWPSAGTPTAPKTDWLPARYQLDVAQRYDLPRLSAAALQALYVRDEVAQTLLERHAQRASGNQVSANHSLSL